MQGQLLSRERLGESRTEEMYQLIRRHFDGVNRSGFERDLVEKDWVILLRDAGSGALNGFSTFLMYPVYYDNEWITVVYSGDTIVDPKAWNSPELSRTWIRSVRRLHAKRGRGRLFWLLITSGFRTYRFLPVFFREFFPRTGTSTPPKKQALIERLARERFGERYDSRAGLVRLDRPQRLREHLREVCPSRLGNPHVAYFLERNPGFACGDELVCLTELDDANLTPAGRRMLFGNTPLSPVTETRPA